MLCPRIELRLCCWKGSAGLLRCVDCQGDSLCTNMSAAEPSHGRAVQRVVHLHVLPHLCIIIGAEAIQLPAQRLSGT